MQPKQSDGTQKFNTEALLIVNYLKNLKLSKTQKPWKNL